MSMRRLRRAFRRHRQNRALSERVLAACGEWREQHEEYLRATLASAGVPLDRQVEIGAVIRDGQLWHPRTVGEIRAALVIARDKLDGRPAGIAVLPYVGRAVRPPGDD